jgi:hypothetical protein
MEKLPEDQEVIEETPVVEEKNENVDQEIAEGGEKVHPDDAEDLPKAPPRRDATKVVYCEGTTQFFKPKF